MTDRRLLWTLVAVWLLTVGAGIGAQVPPARPQQPPAAAPATEPVQVADPLGRDTPRGTVLGFLEAARRGDSELARQYLDTRLGTAAAQALADQLFVVLDAKLPARLPQISQEPGGSRANPLAPNLEVIGTIPSAAGDVRVVVERVERLSRAGPDPIWLFSNETLQAVPALYGEVTRREAARRLPAFLERTGVGGFSRFEWLVGVVGIPLFFLAASLLNRLLVAIARPLWRRFASDAARPVTTVLPVPARLLLFALVTQWVLPAFPLSLRVRQFWSSAATALAILSMVLLAIILNAEIERFILRRTSRGDRLRHVGVAAVCSAGSPTSFASWLAWASCCGTSASIPRRRLRGLSASAASRSRSPRRRRSRT